jgi:glucose repression regulatory protein TUP1
VTCLRDHGSNVVERSCRVLTVSESAKSDVAFTSVSISQDSHYVAAGSLDGVIRVWDLIAIPEDAAELEGAKLADRLRGHEKSVYSVKFVPGINISGRGKTLISGSLDTTLKRWEVGPFDAPVQGVNSDAEGTGENGSTCVKTYKGHNDYVLATSIVTEGQNHKIASASRDGSVRLWDLRTGMTQIMIQGHKNTVTSLDLSLDGRQLVTGSGDCEVRIWTYTIL